jgi:hypothetical protein
MIFFIFQFFITFCFHILKKSQTRFLFLLHISLSLITSPPPPPLSSQPSLPKPLILCLSNAQKILPAAHFCSFSLSHHHHHHNHIKLKSHIKIACFTYHFSLSLALSLSLTHCRSFISLHSIIVKITIEANFSSSFASSLEHIYMLNLMIGIWE